MAGKGSQPNRYFIQFGCNCLFYIATDSVGSRPGFSQYYRSFYFSFNFPILGLRMEFKTHSAVIGILISLILTGIISAFFINFTRLTGFGDENAMFLVQLTSQNINMRGLLLAGMIIGALGVLDDLVISQASAIFELHASQSRILVLSVCISVQ